MTTDIRVLDSEEDLLAAANVFRVAMVGFPPLRDLAPGQTCTKTVHWAYRDATSGFNLPFTAPPTSGTPDHQPQDTPATTQARLSKVS